MKRITDKFELQDGRRVILHASDFWMLMAVKRDSPTSIEFTRLGFLQPKFDSKPLDLDEEAWFTIDKSDFDNFVSASQLRNHQPQKKKVLSHKLLNLACRIESLDHLDAEDASVVMLIQPNQSKMTMRICQRTEPFGFVTLAAFTEDGLENEAICLPDEEGKIIQVDDIDFSNMYMFRVDPIQGMLNLLKYECNSVKI